VHVCFSYEIRHGGAEGALDAGSGGGAGGPRCGDRGGGGGGGLDAGVGGARWGTVRAGGNI